MKYKLILCFCLALIISCEEESSIEPEVVPSIDLSNIRAGQRSRYQEFAFYPLRGMVLDGKSTISIEENEYHIFLQETVNSLIWGGIILRPNVKYIELISRIYSTPTFLGGFIGDTLKLDETLAVSVQQDGYNINLDSTLLPTGVVGKLEQFSLFDQNYNNVLVMRNEYSTHIQYVIYNKNQILMYYRYFPLDDILMGYYLTD